MGVQQRTKNPPIIYDQYFKGYTDSLWKSTLLMHGSEVCFFFCTVKGLDTNNSKNGKVARFKDRIVDARISEIFARKME